MPIILNNDSKINNYYFALIIVKVCNIIEFYN